MIAPAPADVTVLPPEVSDFAGGNGVTSCVRPVLAATGECFPSCSIALRLEQDAEVDSDTHIVIEVDVSGWSADEMFSARNRWSDEFGRACPGDKTYLFQIRLVQRP
jgi:hypothetical protein